MQNLEMSSKNKMPFHRVVNIAVLILVLKAILKKYRRYSRTDINTFNDD